MPHVRINRTQLARCLSLVAALGALLSPEATKGQAAPPAPEHETVVDVRIDGAKTISLGRLRPFIRTRENRPLDLSVVAEDVKRLASMRAFVDVRPLYYRVPSGGVVVIFRVIERPILEHIKYVGNTQVRDKKIAERTELKVGDARDPYAIEEARRQIEELYHEKGFSKASVTVFEGSDHNDRGAVFLIHEGPKRKIRRVKFEGHNIASAARLKTLIESKPPIFWVFRGQADEEKIDRDVERLTAYYRSLGFFGARIGRDLDMDPTSKWLTLTFVIDEGPRYVVRDVVFTGSKKFSREQLLADLKLQPGEFFNQPSMNFDANAIQQLYGAEGHIYADVEANPRFFEEPGQMDLVYHIDEGARFRIGRVRVNIKGENPHTRHHTVLNYVSIRPGEIADIREKQASERRLGASRLFETNPVNGNPPTIRFEISDNQAEQLADREKRRGQSPRSTARDRGVDAAAGPVSSEGEPYRGSGRQQVTSRPIFRGQNAPFGGRTLPQLDPRAPAGTLPRTAPSYPPRTAYPQYPPGRYAPPVQAGPSIQNGSPPQYQSAPPVQGGPPPVYQPAPPVQSGPPQGYQSVPAPIQTSPPPTYQAVPPPGSYVAQPFNTTVQPPGFENVAPPADVLNPPVVDPLDQLANPSGVYPDGGYSFVDPLPPEVDVIVEAEETTTGRFMFGVGVNSDAGLVGNIVIDEQNFDIWRFPRSWDDIRNATAWRGAGQRFRIEAVPGTQLQRYLVSFTEPYLFDTPVSLGLSGFFFDRIYRDWDEQRLGGRVSLGYELTPDLTAVASARAENVNVRDPAVPTPPDLANVLGDSDLYVGRVALTHDTRDNAFLATEGHLVELAYEQGFGEFDFPRGSFDYRRYFLIRQRPDTSGRHVLSFRGRVAATGSQTPIFERYFAGGFSTLRGFDFRGASPRVFNVVVGGDFLVLGSLEYLFPITADDMLRAVVFTDFGTVEESVKFESGDFRVAPGFGLRITVPALGPAPIALDLAFPVAHAAGDEIENFTFFVGFGR